MIKGIGVDLVEKSRMKEIVENKPAFVKRVLTENEQMVFASLKGHRQVEFLAGRFACKEAYLKAIGTGLGPVSFQEIEILTLDSGQPIVTKPENEGKVFVSISHTVDTAIGQIVIEA
ncbi:holo-ACP synthase [Vagococcus coleopterorum]|uniref:Holo-[acyl-carrier-protein] synthase n=1 Tax=Vagococcus coleopterorum TaxID=2714946 RepID=A0A6G8AMI0_9ENTE|nr:holo-ACP synthase [Vagococcus coleopterorum]QIL46133.1 holo-ACP synthase [Vagococcus coleopterorum]